MVKKTDNKRTQTTNKATDKTAEKPTTNTMQKSGVDDGPGRTPQPDEAARNETEQKSLEIGVANRAARGEDTPKANEAADFVAELEQGRFARENGIGIEDAPYAEGKPLKYWKQGWNDGDKYLKERGR